MKNLLLNYLMGSIKNKCSISTLVRMKKSNLKKEKLKEEKGKTRIVKETRIENTEPEEKRLVMLLADSELELVPESISGHPAIKSSQEKRGKPWNKMLLDASLHHSAMQKLKDGYRRGRPDIAHFFSLLCLDSILNIESKLETIIHTRNDDVIYLNPKTNLPKNYNRFVGLIESLYERNVVPNEENPLLQIRHNLPLAQVLNNINPDLTIAFSPDGEKVSSIPHFFKEIKEKKIACIIGGFPDGDFTSPVYELADVVVSIFDSELKVWTVTSELLAGFRASMLL